MKERIIRASKENCSLAIDFVLSFLEENQCDSPMIRMQVELAIEEIFVNIASYAYPSPDSGDVTITADVSGEQKELTVVFQDGGTPFDPLAKEDPDITLPIEQRRIGGLGIFLVKDNMDDVTYRYADGKNILTIKKRLIDAGSAEKLCV